MIKVRSNLFFQEELNDGSYQAKVFKNGKMKSQPFGYYTNGGALSKSIDIKIYNDSIIATESNSMFY